MWHCQSVCRSETAAAGSLATCAAGLLALMACTIIRLQHQSVRAQPVSGKAASGSVKAARLAGFRSRVWHVATLLCIASLPLHLCPLMPFCGCVCICMWCVRCGRHLWFAAQCMAPKHECMPRGARAAVTSTCCFICHVLWLLFEKSGLPEAWPA
jgi:hypothetical protein